MAVRGRKPKPTHLKLVMGNPGRRPLPQGEPAVAGVLVKPARLKGRAAQLWDEIAGAAPWLAPLDAYKLHLFVELQAQFEASPRKMVAARIAQLRAVASEIGLDPSARARLGAARRDDDPAAKYFGKNDDSVAEFFDD